LFMVGLSRTHSAYCDRVSAQLVFEIETFNRQNRFFLSARAGGFQAEPKMHDAVQLAQVPSPVLLAENTQPRGGCATFGCCTPQ
jgi:hypothetical protein